MKAEIKGNDLVITIPMVQAGQSSKSGKTEIVATSGGNKQTDLTVRGQRVVIGLNAYIPRN